MDKRLEFHEKLVEILGSRNVYFQPPESVKLNMPCIIYNRNDVDVKYADDQVYLKNISYQVIYVDKNPDSAIIDKLIEFRYSRYLRHYISDNLNHDVFIIKY